MQFFVACFSVGQRNDGVISAHITINGNTVETQSHGLGQTTLQA